MCTHAGQIQLLWRAHRTVICYGAAWAGHKVCCLSSYTPNVDACPDTRLARVFRQEYFEKQKGYFHFKGRDLPPSMVSATTTRYRFTVHRFCKTSNRGSSHCNTSLRSSRLCRASNTAHEAARLSTFGTKINTGTYEVSEIVSLVWRVCL